MHKTLLHLRTILKFYRQDRNIEARCRREAVFLFNAFGKKDEDLEALFHYVSETLYLFGIKTTDTDYNTVVKLHKYFWDVSRTEADRLFSPLKYGQQKPSEFIVLVAYIIQQACGLKTHLLRYDGKNTNIESISRTEEVKKILANAQKLTKNFFPDVEDRLVFFSSHFLAHYIVILEKVRKNLK